MFSVGLIIYLLSLSSDNFNVYQSPRLKKVLSMFNSAVCMFVHLSCGFYPHRSTQSFHILTQNYSSCVYFKNKIDIVVCRVVRLGWYATKNNANGCAHPAIQPYKNNANGCAHPATHPYKIIKIPFVLNCCVCFILTINILTIGQEVWTTWGGNLRIWHPR